MGDSAVTSCTRHYGLSRHAQPSRPRPARPPAVGQADRRRRRHVLRAPPAARAPQPRGAAPPPARPELRAQPRRCGRALQRTQELAPTHAPSAAAAPRRPAAAPRHVQGAAQGVITGALDRRARADGQPLSPIATRARAAPTRARALISFMQPSKSVSMESTSAPLAMGCTSCARLILSAGRNTMDGMPAAAQYADSAADVSPGRACRPGCRAARPEQQGWPTAILGHIHKHRTRLASLPERAPLPVATSSAGRSPAGPPQSGCEACACAPVSHRPANQTGADCAALTSTSACLSAQSQAGALDPARKGERKREPVHPPFAAVHGRSPAGAHRWTRSRRPGRPQAEAGAGG